MKEPPADGKSPSRVQQRDEGADTHPGARLCGTPVATPGAQ